MRTKEFMHVLVQRYTATSSARRATSSAAPFGGTVALGGGRAVVPRGQARADDGNDGKLNDQDSLRYEQLFLLLRPLSLSLSLFHSFIHLHSRASILSLFPFTLPRLGTLQYLCTGRSAPSPLGLLSRIASTKVRHFLTYSTTPTPAVSTSAPACSIVVREKRTWHSSLLHPQLTRLTMRDRRP